MIDRGAPTSARIMTLRDGRQLAFHEFGDPSGLPVIFTTGTPMSGDAGLAFDDAARVAGIRWISVDKPGYGLSTFDPLRSLSRYADDVHDLADHLGLDRFGAVGESGGGPHVYAIGRYLPDRLTAIVSLAGLGPAHERWVSKEMMPLNRATFWIARNAPWLLSAVIAPFARAFRPGAPDARREAILARVFKQMGPQDRAALDEDPSRIPLLLAGTAGAFVQGGKATVQEYRIFAKPWEFRLEEIAVPTHIWHGAADSNVPMAVARHIARLIPNVTTHFDEDAGHLVSFGHQDEIMATLRAAAQ